MVKVLAVNNYPARDRFRRLEKCLAANGADVTPIGWKEATAGRFGSFDGVALSGSPDMMSEGSVLAKYQNEVEAIVDSKVPVLGVCFGHQMMARAFGAEVVKDRRHVLGMVETRVLAADPIFDGLPKSLMLLESRYEIVKSLPEGFRLIAKSRTSGIAAMKHEKRPLYGIQFHPERYTKEHPEGKRVMGNFIRTLK